MESDILSDALEADDRQTFRHHAEDFGLLELVDEWERNHEAFRLKYDPPISAS